MHIGTVKRTSCLYIDSTRGYIKLKENFGGDITNAYIDKGLNIRSEDNQA